MKRKAGGLKRNVGEPRMKRKAGRPKAECGEAKYPVILSLYPVFLPILLIFFVYHAHLVFFLLTLFFAFL